MTRNSLSRASVLVVEPNPHMQSLIASMLRALGIHDLADASDAGRAAELLKWRTFDAVLADGGPSGIDGTELTRRLRADEGCPNRYAPVILMARTPDAAGVAAARDAGVTEVLRKPFSARQLEARLVAALEQPRPFIVAEGFRGPDRRRRNAGYDGEERRNVPYAGPDRRAPR